ncbi:MAG: cupin domain-containing protein [Anaerolineae bacterium]
MPFFKVDELTSTQAMEGVSRRAVYLDQVMLTFFDLAPHSIVPKHKHPHEQITFIIEGEMEFTLGNETRVIGKGEGVAIPSNVEHGAKVLHLPTKAIDAWHPPREDYR